MNPLVMNHDVIAVTFILNALAFGLMAVTDVGPYLGWVMAVVNVVHAISTWVDK